MIEWHLFQWHIRDYTLIARYCGMAFIPIAPACNALRSIAGRYQRVNTPTIYSNKFYRIIQNLKIGARRGMVFEQKIQALGRNRGFLSSVIAKARSVD